MDLAKGHMKGAAMEEHGSQRTGKLNRNDVIEKDSLYRESTKLDSRVKTADICKKAQQWDRIPSSVQQQNVKRCLSKKTNQISVNVHEIGVQNSGIAHQRQEIFLESKNRLPNSDSGLDGIEKRNQPDMSYKSNDCINLNTNRKDVYVNVKKKIKGIKDTSKNICDKTGYKTFFTKDIESISAGKKFDEIKCSVENEACSLFEERLQELEKQTSEKCLKFIFTKKKNKGKEKNPLDTRHSCEKRYRRKEVSIKNHENTKLGRKKIHKDKSNEKHKNDGRKHVTKSKKLYGKSSGKKRKKSLEPTNGISISSSVKGRIKIENNRHSFEIPKLKESSEKSISCKYRCYRLQSSQWSASGKCALRLLKRKYHSVRILFYKEPVVILEQLNVNREVKMIGENLEVISVWDAETESAVCSDDVDPNRETSSEEGSLVDPRVMSLSRTLESGHNGKIGVEKTFKSASCKNSQAKTKVCFPLLAAGNVKKPLVQKPDWSKLKEKLKEVNAKQALKKKQAEYGIGKGNKRIPVLKNNPCFNFKNHANPKLIPETVKSIRNNCTNSSEPIIQERKRELEKLCPVSDAVEDVAQQEVNDPSLSEKTLEEFQKNLDESDIDFKMDEYSIEICTESTDEDQSKDPSVDRDLHQTDNSGTGNYQMEDKLNSGQESVETRLTVTSGIIPNLYVTNGLPSEAIGDESLSPPVLQREGVDESEVIALNQYKFVIKDDPDSENGTILITSNDLTTDNSSSNKEDNPKIIEHTGICTVSSDVENSETVDNTPVLQFDSFTSYENAQNIPDQIKNSDNSAPLSHLSLTDTYDNMKDSEASGSSDVPSSSSYISHVTSSRSAVAQNYPRMTEKVFSESESEEYSKEDKANGEDISPDTQTDIAAINDYDNRLSTSSLSDEESLVHDQTQEHTQENNTIGDKHVDGPDKRPVEGPLVFDKHEQPLEILTVTTLSNVNKVFGDLPTLTWSNSLSPVKENINTNKEEHQKKKVTKKDKPKSEKMYRKRKKSLERKYSLENDSEELPKISPPKRRPRPIAKPITKAPEYLSEERLMQDFPKHNWLFNKYSSLSTTTASSNNKVTTADAKEYSETHTKLTSTGTNALTMKHNQGLENTSGTRSQEEIIKTSTAAAQLNALTNMAPSVLSPSSQPVTTLTTASAYSLNSPKVHQSTFSRNIISKPVSSELDQHKATSADAENSFNSNETSASARNQSVFEHVSSELMRHHGKGSPKTLENSAAKIDTLKSNFHHDTINLHYDEGSSEQINCYTTGHHDLKMDEEIDKNASRPFLTYQSLKKQGDSKSSSHKDTDSCDKGTSYTVTKTVDAEKMETSDYCDTMLQQAAKNLDQDLGQQKHISDIDSISTSQVYAASHIADKSSVDINVTMLGVQAHSSGNACHSDQEVVTMVTEEVEHSESVPQKVFGSAKSQSLETITESSAVKESAIDSNTVELGDHLRTPSSCGKTGTMEASAAKQVPVETSGVNFRQKPSLPVLRVQPHLYKPPGTINNTSSDPPRANGTVVVSVGEIPVSLGSAGNGSVPSSTEPSTARTQEVCTSVSQDNFTQIKVAVVPQSTSLSSVSYSHSASKAQSELESKTPGNLKMAEVAVPAVLGTFSNPRNNAGMVIPVQPIIQTTVSTTVISGNITGQSLNSTASSNSISNQLVTNYNINLNSNNRPILPNTVTPTPPSGHIPINAPYVYHQQPAIIRLQTPTINPAGMFEINRLTQIPQTNQLFLLDSDNSVIPISTPSTGSAETSSQHVLATVQSAQEQPHIGQILSGSHIIITQPVCARAAQNSLTVVDNTSEVIGVKKIDGNSTTASERTISSESESVVGESSNLYNNSNDKQAVTSGIVKSEESKSQEGEPATLSDEDEEFKRQMDELDREIKRKEREHEEMRKKKLELLEKRRKTARCLQKVKSEGKQEEKLVEGSDVGKNKLDEKDQANTEESSLGFNMMVDSSKHSSGFHKSKETIYDKTENFMEASVFEETEVTSKANETVNETSERNKRISITDKANVETEARNNYLQDAKEDKDEDSFEGALVIDLSATSKENGNSSQLVMHTCSPATEVIYESDIKSESEREGHLKNTVTDNCVAESSIRKQCDPCHESEQVGVNNDSIEYIGDISRVNPFTGEVDTVESQYHAESLDLSKKPANQVRADISGTDKLEENTHAENVSNMGANDTEKQSLEDDSSMTCLSRQTEKNQEKVACEMVSEQDDGSLDLSVKPLCVFTFKKGDEIKDTPHTFCCESTPENDPLTQRKPLTHFDNQPNDAVKILNTGKEPTFEPTSESVVKENESQNMRSNMITSAARRDSSTSVITGRGPNKDAAIADLDNHTLSSKSALVCRYSERNIPLKIEASADEFIGNQGSDSQNPLSNKNVGNKVPIDPDSMQTSVSSSSTDKNIGKKSEVESQTLALLSDQVPVDTNLQPTQHNRSVHLGQPSPANQGPYKPHVPYRPTTHEQRHERPSGFHSSEVVNPPNQERIPGYLSIRASFSSVHSQGHYRTQEKPKGMKHTEPHGNINPSYNLGLNSAKNDFLRSRGYPSGRQQAQRRSKEMYMEIEPAHTKPIPKKIPKYAKPSPAHIQEVNMKEVFRKMNKSHSQVPLVIQQTGPYFKRRDPVFQAPDDQQSKTRSMDDKPKPAHCQKPFSIAGQLIVTRKKPSKRNASEKIGGPLPKRFLSVPPSSPPPQEEIQRSSSATPNIPYDTDNDLIEVALPSQRSSVDDITSPVRAHFIINNIEGNHSITTDQVVKPPLPWREDCMDSSPKASEIIDLTVVESPKVEASDHLNHVSEGQISTETVVQSELNAALAKRQNHDLHLSTSMNVISQSAVSHTLAQHDVTEVCRPPRAKPPPPQQYGNFQVRMPAPQSRPTRLRQPDYSRPRQVLAPVPIDRPRLPEPVPRPSITQALLSHHSNRVPAHAYHQEREPMISRHHSPQQALFQSVPRVSAAHEQQPLMAHRHPRNVGPSSMPELSNQNVDKVLPHDSVYQRNSGFHPYGKDSFHHSSPDIPQSIPGQKLSNSEKAYQQFIIPPPNRQETEPSHGPGQRHLQPQTSPRNPVLSPSSPHERLPPSPRGEVQQNWLQIQKMQQIRANHLRNREVQSSQSLVAREMGIRTGYSNTVHPGMVENFIQGPVQDPGQKYQPSSKQHPVQQTGLHPHKPIHMQSMETNQFLGPHSTINQYRQASQMTNQMATKKLQASPPTSTRYYHLGPPEAQFITTVNQIPPSRPNQHSGHNRSLSHTQTAYQSQTKQPGIVPDFQNQPVRAHSMRNSEQVIHQGQHQYFPQKSWHGNSPHHNKVASTYPVSNLSVHQGHGQAQMQASSGQHTQGPMLTKVPQDHPVKIGQDQEQEDMPHVQQVNGTCILCGRYSLYLCSSCKKIWYCSPECQLKHWQTHAHECKGPAG